MALRTLPDIGAGEPLHEGSGRLQAAGRRRGQVEHAAAGREGLGTAAIAEQPIRAQALEATGEPRQQEAPDALSGREAPHLEGVVLPIIAPAEVDDAVLHSDETRMADGHPMGIAPEVRYHLLGACAGRLGIDDPLLPPEGIQPLDKRGGLLQRRCPRGNMELPLGEGGVEAIEILPAQDPREGAHGEQELPTPCRNPALLLGRQSTTRHETMHVEMLV